MDNYCSKCGNRLKTNAAFCHHCGAASEKQVYASSELSAMATLLANGSLAFAKGMALLLGGGMALACSLSAVSLLVGACYLIYNFTKGLTVIVPFFISRTFSITAIRGFGLLFSGLTSAFIAILFIMAVVALAKGIYGWNKKEN